MLDFNDQDLLTEAPKRVVVDSRSSVDPSGVAAADAVERLARISVKDWSLSEVLAVVAKIAAGRVPGTVEVSISLVENGRVIGVGFSDRRLAALDERQFPERIGPCITAAENGTVTVIDHTSETERYPDFAQLAARQGFNHSITFGCPALGSKHSGALTFYGISHVVGSGGPAHSTDLADFTELVFVVLADAVALHTARQEAAGLREAMRSRATIEQAKGIIMAARGCGPDAAFAYMRRLSNDSNQQLKALARELVRSMLDHPLLR